MISASRSLAWGPDDAGVVVLAVHGRGQEPEFMRQLVTRFGPLPARFAAPAATGRSWYPKPFLVPLEENQPDLDHALADIDESVERLGVAPERLVLLGFSQGACLLAHYLLGRPRVFGAAVLFTGGFVGPDPIPPREAGSLDGVPVVLRSIEHDPWVPPGRVRESAVLFEAAGARVDLRIDPGDEHVITDEACATAGALIRSLDATR